MKRESLFPFLFTLLAMILVACAKQPAAQAGDPTKMSSGIVKDQASLIGALQSSGAKVETGDTVDQPFFSVKGQTLRVNGADMQVFEYPSTEALEAEAKMVAPDGGSVGTSMVSWVSTPHFYKADRVLVLYVGDDATTLSLLKGILGEQFAGR